jgi:hypothetical protein
VSNVVAVRLPRTQIQATQLDDAGIAEIADLGDVLLQPCEARLVRRVDQYLDGNLAVVELPRVDDRTVTAPNRLTELQAIVLGQRFSASALSGGSIGHAA